MKKIILSILSLLATISVFATTYNYKCGPKSIEVVDNSYGTYYEFELTITQDAKNTVEYTKTTVYASTVKLIIHPKTSSIAGTFTTDDYSIDSFSYVLYNGNYRYVSSYGTSSITITKGEGNKYSLTDGTLVVENSTGSNTYYYNFCYANADLNDSTAPKVPFEFTYGSAAPEVGEMFTYNGLNYKVVSVTDGAETVEVEKYNQGYEYEGEIVIPATVSYKDVTFKVAAIAPQAFTRCYEMTELTIGANVKTIGNAAFSMCTGLTTITCNASAPSVGLSAFYKVNPSVIPSALSGK